MKFEHEVLKGNKTDEAKKICEVIEFVMINKEKSFVDFLTRIDALTSDTGWRGILSKSQNGYYLELEGTRARFTCFVQDSKVIRKPKNVVFEAVYMISGNGTDIHKIYKLKNK